MQNQRAALTPPLSTPFGSGYLNRSPTLPLCLPFLIVAGLWARAKRLLVPSPPVLEQGWTQSIYNCYYSDKTVKCLHNPATAGDSLTPGTPRAKYTLCKETLPFISLPSMSLAGPLVPYYGSVKKRHRSVAVRLFTLTLQSSLL